MTDLFDVIATNIRTRVPRVLDRGMTRENADAYVRMAVMRRGVEVEFLSEIPSPRAAGLD